MATRRDAIERLGAVETSDGRWAYYAAETRHYYCVDAETLDDLVDLLNDADLASDAYSHWCAQGGALELPDDDALRVMLKSALSTGMIMACEDALRGDIDSRVDLFFTWLGVQVISANAKG